MWSPLAYATRYGNETTVKWLLQKKSYLSFIVNDYNENRTEDIISLAFLNKNKNVICTILDYTGNNNLKKILNTHFKAVSVKYILNDTNLMYFTFLLNNNLVSGIKNEYIYTSFPIIKRKQNFKHILNILLNLDGPLKKCSINQILQDKSLSTAEFKYYSELSLQTVLNYDIPSVYYQLLCNLEIKDSHLKIFESQEKFQRTIKYTIPSLQKKIIEKICIRKLFNNSLLTAIHQWGWKIRVFHDIDIVKIINCNLNFDKFVLSSQNYNLWKNYWYTLCKNGFPLIIDISIFEKSILGNEINYLKYFQRCMRSFRLMRRVVSKKERILRTIYTNQKKKVHFELLSFPKQDNQRKIINNGSLIYQQMYIYFSS